MKCVVISVLLFVAAVQLASAGGAPGSPVEIGDAVLYRAVSDGGTGLDVVLGSTNSVLAVQRVDGEGYPYANHGPVVSRMSQTSSLVRAVPDGSGGTIFAGISPLRLQRIDGAGRLMWIEPGVLIGSPSVAGFDLIADGSGGAVIAWEDGSDIRAQRVDSLGHTIWTSGGVVVCNAANLQVSPQMCADANGGVIVSWLDGRSGANTAVFGQRLNGAGAPQWAANGVSVIPPTSLGTNSIVTDGAGGACIVVSNTSGASPVLAQRISPAGSLLWGAGVSLSAGSVGGANANSAPNLCSDGNGGFVLAWAPSDNLVHAQRVTGAGVIAWPSAGILVAPSIGIQASPAVVADGVGGAVIVWQDQRNPGFGNDIYAQRLDASGLTTWGPSGIAVCDAVGTQFGAIPVLAADGSVNVVWSDARRSLDGLSAIYYQRLSPTGAALVADREHPTLVGVRDAGGDQGG